MGWEQTLLNEIQELRRDNGKEFKEVKGQLSDMRVEVARTTQKLVDHCADTGLHRPADKPVARPCEELRTHLRRHWAVFIILLTAIVGEVVALIFMVAKMAHGVKP